MSQILFVLSSKIIQRENFSKKRYCENDFGFPKVIYNEGTARKNTISTVVALRKRTLMRVRLDFLFLPSKRTLMPVRLVFLRPIDWLDKKLTKKLTYSRNLIYKLG